MKAKRLVYICDWLPPDFGAVGQYADLFARRWAEDGWHTTLVGLSSQKTSDRPAVRIGSGSLEVLRIHRPTYRKQKFATRLIWTTITNMALLGGAFGAMR